MRTRIILLSVVMVSFLGCAAQVPRPSNFPLMSQEQLQSASHWQLVAQRTFMRLRNEVSILRPDAKGNIPRIYVQDSDKSPFDRAFRNYLLTELNGAHFLLADTPEAPIVVNWDVQLVTRDTPRLKPQGFPEYLAEAVWEFFTGSRWTTRGPFVSHSEAILTTWITIGGAKPGPSRLVRSYSDVFYINDGDWDNYDVAYPDAYFRTIAAQEEAWKVRLARQGLLAR